MENVGYRCNVTQATIKIVEGRDSLDQLRNSLMSEPDLRVRPVTAPPRSGEMGSAADTLAVILAPGGAAVIFVSALVSWLRSRTSDVRVEVSHRDRKLSMTANRVSRLDGEDLARLVDSAVRELDLGDHAETDDVD